MRRNRQTTKHFGFHLRVSYDDGKSFTLEGGLFVSRYAAEQYHAGRSSISALPYRIHGVRLSTKPVEVRENSQGADSRFVARAA